MARRTAARRNSYSARQDAGHCGAAGRHRRNHLQSVGRARRPQSLRQRSETRGLECVDRCGCGERSHVRVEVVDTANARIDDILHRSSRQDCVSIATDRETLLTDSHWHRKGISASRSIESLAVIARGDLDGGWRREERHHEDRVLHGLIAIRPATEEVSAGIVGITLHCGVGRIAVDALGRRPIPINELVLGDELADEIGPSLVRRDERLRHLEPSVVRPDHWSAALNSASTGSKKILHVHNPL